MKVVKVYLTREEIQELILNKLEEKYKNAEVLPKFIEMSDADGTITLSCYVAPKWDEEDPDSNAYQVRRSRLLN